MRSHAHAVTKVMACGKDKVTMPDLNCFTSVIILTVEPEFVCRRTALGTNVGGNLYFLRLLHSRGDKFGPFLCLPISLEEGNLPGTMVEALHIICIFQTEHSNTKNSIWGYMCATLKLEGLYKRLRL